jgi:hypothetical protein
MKNQRPEQNTEEFLQSQLEHHIRIQCELHGWATAVSVANPVDILIMFEEQDEEFDQLKTLNRK